MRRRATVFLSAVAVVALATGCYHDDVSGRHDEIRCDPQSGCLVCDGNTCYPYACDSDDQCLEGYTCTASGRCAFVASDDDAANDLVCDASGCQVCQDTALGRDCTAYVCDAGHACPDGYLCEVGSCVPDGGGADCPTECCANADCAQGFICSLDGACVERPVEPIACDAETPCGDDQVCEDGVCVAAPAACGEDAPCAEGEVCEDGVCVAAPPACDGETPCAEGEVCEDGVCVAAPPECEAAVDCGAGEACIEGACEPRDFPVRPAERCVIAGDCGPDGTCIDGACHFPCDDETPCPVTQTCADGLCRAQTASPGECVIGLDCPTEDARCIDGTCRPVCEADADCARHERCDADRGLCEPDPRPVYECLQSADCAADRDCVDGRCLLSCTDDEACGANEICEQGWCAAQFSCFDSEGCNEGEVCVNGTCETF